MGSGQAGSIKAAPTTTGDGSVFAPMRITPLPRSLRQVATDHQKRIRVQSIQIGIVYQMQDLE
jgi:hypothetical protein